jgi:hypothetical protein
VKSYLAQYKAFNGSGWSWGWKKGELKNEAHPTMLLKTKDEETDTFCLATMLMKNKLVIISMPRCL